MQVKLINYMGSDLTVVNAARVSFNKQSGWETGGWEPLGDDDWQNRPQTLSKRDAKLIGYLAAHGHWTPFAHPQITLHVSAPVFVRTQCFKHKVGFTENEISRRYVDDEPVLYEPTEWRGRAENAKQGSSGPIDFTEGGWKTHPSYYVAQFYMEALGVYKRLIEQGVAPEQARMVLPQSMMTEWYWTGSLAAFARFYNLRTHETAQEETRVVAEAIALDMARLFPVSWAALTQKEGEA